MKNKKQWMWSAVLLAGCSAAGPTLAAATQAERPQPENYATYSLYLQALFDYRKAQTGSNPGSADELCRDTRASDDSDKGNTKKKNACEERASLYSNPNLDAGRTEDLDAAVAKAAAGANPGYTDTSVHPRTTYNSFPLSPIPVTDLSQTGVGGLLGFFGPLIPGRQIAPDTTARLRPSNSISLTPDTTLRLINDAYSVALDSLSADGVNFGAVLHLSNGSGTIDATAAATANGASITLSSDVRTGMYLVDRDGIPGTGSYSRAGALTIDSMGIQLKDVRADITAKNLGNVGANDLLNATITSPNAIIVDFSGTHVGVADAQVDTSIPSGTSTFFSVGQGIGSPTTVLSFGPNSRLIIAPGLTLTSTLGHPNGTTSPLITLNGDVGSLSLSDVSLLDGGNTALHVGNISVDGIRLVNARIFIDQQKVIVDMGSGTTNLDMGLERVSLGNDPVAGSLGDVYLSHAHITNMQMTVAAH